MVESDPEIEFADMARNGMEGVEMVRNLRPDCITLDIEMPRMNGLEALDIIMREFPTPALVVSSLSTEGAAVILEALEKGAMDYIPKTQSYVAIDITKVKDELIRKVKAIVGQNPTLRSGFMAALKRRQKRREALDADVADDEMVPIPARIKAKDYKILAIGVSTGSPPLVQYILENLSPDFPFGIMVAQHMPATFTKTFADRLNKLSPLEVMEAEHGEEIKKGTVLIGKGGQHIITERRGTHVVLDMSQNHEGYLYFPPADLMFASAANVYGAQTLGVILTGMGQDGLIDLRETRKAGGTIVAQDEETGVVYGMPKAVASTRIDPFILFSGNLRTNSRAYSVTALSLVILFVEDSPTMRRIISNSLRRLGFADIIEAENGVDALEKLEGHTVQLVVNDWNMPEMNGAELVKTLRADANFNSVPIVMITTRGMKDDVITAMKLGVNAYVIKPFTPDILKQRLDSIM